MKVIYGIGKIKKTNAKIVLAIGVFDGLHLGHQEVIGEALERAKVLGGKAVVLTFSPHPMQVLHPENHLSLIVSLDHRLKLIEEFGVDTCVVIPFTHRFSMLSPDNFIKRYLVDHIDPCEVYVGDDFRFGHNREGNLNFFRGEGARKGFEVHGVHFVRIASHIKKANEKRKISSTFIRRFIHRGALNDAALLLSRRVSVMGIVEKGAGRGESLGFPTINIYPHDLILPPLGVYAVFVLFEKVIYKGVANVGVCPSFGRVHEKPNIEVHVFDIKKNFYGKQVIVEFVSFLRKEMLFDCKDDLIREIHCDAKKARRILGKISSSAV